MVSILDINGDGKISLKEFKYWWFNGRKGKMSELVYLRAKSIKLAQEFMQNFTSAGTEAS
jgi:hypothetical protein